MYARLFAESGLSLDRLRALVEVGAHGSIVRAAGSDPVRQSQYSRQIKELEDFFRIGLVERHGKGIRLTAGGRELARISRFFLLGLSSFQRGCLAQEQTYRIAAPPTFAACFLMPMLAQQKRIRSGLRWTIVTAPEEEMERRLHDLTLDFAVITKPVWSRPLQAAVIGSWQLRLRVPKALFRSADAAAKAYAEGRLPVAFAAGELPAGFFTMDHTREAALTCESFLEAKIALAEETAAALLPDFLSLPGNENRFLSISPLELEGHRPDYRLVWNPRLMRLNPSAQKCRETLTKSLVQTFTGV